MPLIIAPYTFGSNQTASGGAVVSGAGYYLRRKRFIAYILTGLLLVLL